MNASGHCDIHHNDQDSTTSENNSNYISADIHGHISKQGIFSCLVFTTNPQCHCQSTYPFVSMNHPNFSQQHGAYF